MELSLNWIETVGIRMCSVDNYTICTLNEQARTGFDVLESLLAIALPNNVLETFDSIRFVTLRQFVSLKKY